MADQIITKQKLIDADKDADRLNIAVNGSKTQKVTTRGGVQYPTLSGAIQTIIDAGGFTPFSTEAALLQSIPVVVPSAAKALDTKKIWIYESRGGVTKWYDTGLSELDLAKEFSNSNPLFKAKALTGSDNLNSIFASGFYLASLGVNATLENNYPLLGSKGLGVMQVYHLLTGSTGTLAVQVFYGVGDNGIYTRNTNAAGTAWNSWNQILTKTALDSITMIKTIADGTDLNSLTVRGDYALTRAKATTYLNTPPQITDAYDTQLGGTLSVVVSNEAPVVHQIYHAQGGAGSYIRAMVSLGVWTSWVQLGNRVLAYRKKDLNLLVRTGLYICNTVDTLAHHYPVSDQLLVNVFAYDNVYRQVAYQRSNNTVWTRSYWGSSGWQNWVKLSSQSDIDTVNQKIAELDARKVNKQGAQLTDLYNDLHNPLMSVNIKLVGDSITWGSGASNLSASGPRSGTLADVRNTTETSSPTWANLLRQWLCTTFADGPVINESNGSAYSQSENPVLISKDIDLLKFSNPSRQLNFTSAEVKTFVVENPSIDSKEYIDLNSPIKTENRPSQVEFMANGEGVTVVFAKFGYAADDQYFFNIYIDDVFYKKVGLYNATAVFNSEVFITLPNNGKHKITLKNESTVAYPFRIQQLKVNKTVRIVNDGIIGSSTRSWLNSVKLSDSIKRKDDYVFVQLGTNDRITSVNNSHMGTYRNLKQIISDIYTLSDNNAKIILMSANAVTQDEKPSTSSYFMNMRIINNIIQTVAKENKVSFISNFEETQQLKLDGVSYLADGLHPNDLGHRKIFENIRNCILEK